MRRPKLGNLLPFTRLGRGRLRCHFLAGVFLSETNCGVSLYSASEQRTVAITWPFTLVLMTAVGIVLGLSLVLALPGLGWSRTPQESRGLRDFVPKTPARPNTGVPNPLIQTSATTRPTGTPSAPTAIATSDPASKPSPAEPSESLDVQSPNPLSEAAPVSLVDSGPPATSEHGPNASELATGDGMSKGGSQEGTGAGGGDSEEELDNVEGFDSEDDSNATETVLTSGTVTNNGSDGWEFVDSPGQGYFPCHPNKGLIDTTVSCRRVEIPSLLCKRCALRPVTISGEFLRCDNIFDTATDACKEAMMEYVEANRECDPARASTVPKWIAGDVEATKAVDYFLYSVCELCCDCIPMGIRAADFRRLRESHSEASPTLWDAHRGNCPAHAEYDLCRVLPKAAYFTGVGEPEDDRPSVCPDLNSWLNSERSSNWQTDPSTEISNSTERFLEGALAALMCHRSFIWRKCFAMEKLQDHIDIPLNSESGPEPGSFEEDAATPPDMVDGQESDASGSTEESVGSCFPSNATIELQSGKVIRMDELHIGDRVRVSEFKFSDVYMFSHRDETSAPSVYLRVTAGEVSVVMTEGHYLHVKRKSSNPILVQALHVVVGDNVELGSGLWKPVTDVSTVSAQGLFNPHTIDGSIVVDGIRTSTFTNAIAFRTSQALLSPIRALYNVGGIGERQMGSFLRRGVPSGLLHVIRHQYGSEQHMSKIRIRARVPARQ